MLIFLESTRHIIINGKDLIFLSNPYVNL